MREQIGHVVKRSVFDPQNACKVVPRFTQMRMLNSGIQHNLVEQMPPTFKRLVRLRRLEHTPSHVGPAVHNPQGRNSSII